LKGTEIAIKKIRTSFEKQIERTNKKFELKGKIKKKIKLTNKSETNKKKERMPISNELNDDKWDFKKMIKANPVQPSELMI